MSLKIVWPNGSFRTYNDATKANVHTTGEIYLVDNSGYWKALIPAHANVIVESVNPCSSASRLARENGIATLCERTLAAVKLLRAELRAKDKKKGGGRK